MTVRILKLREAHIPGLLVVWKDFMDYHAAFNPHFTRSKTGHEAFEKYLRQSLNTLEMAVFVAVEGDKVVGYTLLQLHKPPPVYDNATFGVLSDMAVLDGYRRQGVGEKLLARSRSWFKQKGVKWVELSVVTGNPSGAPFWAKQGFKELMRRLYLEI